MNHWVWFNNFLKISSIFLPQFDEELNPKWSLLMGEFSPLIFSVNIDRYVVISAI
jgi:hypothetical protein